MSRSGSVVSRHHYYLERSVAVSVVGHARPRSPEGHSLRPIPRRPRKPCAGGSRLKTSCAFCVCPVLDRSSDSEYSVGGLLDPPDGGVVFILFSPSLVCLIPFSIMALNNRLRTGQASIHSWGQAPSLSGHYSDSWHGPLNSLPFLS